jgi:cell division protein FtsI/penicillin-binding protein 2
VTPKRIGFIPIAMFVLAGACTLTAQPSPAGLEGSVSQLMTGRAGTIVVLDVASGKILAEHDGKLAAQRVAAPGSAIKPFVLMELMRSGKLEAGKRVFCRRTLTIAGRHMDCTHSPAVNNPNAPEALAYSCNIYFATVATQFTPAELKQLLERAGFTALTRLALDETTGRVTMAPDTPHLQLQALGEWGIEITPLELAAAYRALALQRRNGNADSVAGPVFEGLEGSVQFGMAHAAQVPGLSVAGKTGTSANPGSPQTHGFFAGYAPSDKPEIVVMVYLEPGRGSDAAAIAGSVFKAYSAGRERGHK